MAKSFFSVELKTKPYLSKFMKCIHGEHLQFHISDDFGRWIAICLEKNVLPDMNKQTVTNYLVDYTTTIKLKFPYHWLLHSYYGCTIKDKNTIFINKEIQHRFEQKLYLYVERHSIPDKRYKKLNEAIESFAAKYNIIIDEDISWDALVKLVYRLRIKHDNDIYNTPEHRKEEIYQGILFN